MKLSAGTTVYQAFLEWLKDSRGVTAIEYGLIIAAIAIVIIVVVMLMGDSLVHVFSTLDSGLTEQIEESQQ